ncbi:MULTISPECIES: hypothetical protein [unclassified Brenneria]|uniref:hypothetical protein n=1 Tax=unclassified Brenneria TaxID=2634434 RepID=UPI0029C3B9F5|nr:MULTISPECIES: hypothetical protein [unclassified Brenneria]MDX5629005.1 hypothetical protein [Brenneria sp. L3-3Z]MDX5696144.1 hypothetical protein [Brenneria sp. L4-2C]
MRAKCCFSTAQHRFSLPRPHISMIPGKLNGPTQPFLFGQTVLVENKMGSTIPSSRGGDEKKVGFIPCSIKLFLIRHIVSLQTARYDAAPATKKFSGKIFDVA